MNETKSSDQEKTKLLETDENSKFQSGPEPGYSETLLNPNTTEMDYHSTQTVNRNIVSTDKTQLVFNKNNIQKRVQDELVDIPDYLPEDLEPEYLASLIKSTATNRSDVDNVKFNRNFLRDAQPFQIERLMEELKNMPTELLTGFPSLDQFIRIPLHKLTLIASRAGHGKTVFLLNTLLNMIHRYDTKHFLFYTYGEPRREIEIKLINMCGEKTFSNPVEGITSNFERWKYEFKQLDPETLKQKAETDPEFIGLKNFLKNSPRLHIMDCNYNIHDLYESINSFHRTLSVGAVFIDYLQAIRPNKELMALTRKQQMQDILEQLREIGKEFAFPLIIGARLKAPETLDTPEYDSLSSTFIKDIEDPEHASGLIIGLQNYAKSLFIGSNINHQFKSRFYNRTFEKAELMPPIFKDKHPSTVILAKVLANQGRPEPEVELVFNKWLMKISDLKEEHIAK